MSRPSSILAVAQRSKSDTVLLAKAAALARAFGFGLELFLCESEQAYVLKHSYVPSSRGSGLNDCVVRARDYLITQRKLVDPAVGNVSIEVECVSPLYEAVVAKVRRSRPDLVMKAAGMLDERGHSAFDENDWQLMRTCPATIALVQTRHWRKRLRIAAAVDVSDAESDGLSLSIVRTARRLALATGGELDLIYAEQQPPENATSRAATERLRLLARRADLDDEHAHILVGSPEREIPSFAAGRDYDVLALGALTQRKVPVQLVGDLTAALIEVLNCDFLLIKPDSVLQADRGERHARAGEGDSAAEGERNEAMRAWMQPPPLRS